VIQTTYNQQNFLKIGCTYNPESVKYAIESGIDLSFMFTKNDNPFNLACKYQPEACKYLLESKYVNSKMIIESVNGRTSIDDAYDMQPKALYYILQSKHFVNDMLNLEDDRGYKLMYRIKNVFPEVTDVKSISKVNVIEHDNELSMTSENACNVCYTFKPKVILIPCFHTLCVACSFRLHKCPQCRVHIDCRKIVY